MEVENIVPVGADAHTYEPTPQTMIDVAEADAFIYNGASLEPFADKITSAVEDYDVVTLEASAATDLIAREHDHEHGNEHDAHNHEAEDEHGHHDHDEEDGHDPMTMKEKGIALQPQLTIMRRKAAHTMAIIMETKTPTFGLTQFVQLRWQKRLKTCSLS